MKTCDLFKPENIGSNFLRKLNGVQYHFGTKGILYDENGNAAITLRIDEDWELVPKEVTWQEAIQAWVDGKCIKVKSDRDEFLQSTNYRLGLSGDGELNKLGISSGLFRTGKWYIL